MLSRVRYLVTGAAGFIGSSLCRRLVAEGSEVVGLDDLSTGSLDALVGLPELRFEETDVRDTEAVARAAWGCDVVLHHAAMTSVQRSMAEPEVFTDVNVRGTLNVLLAAERTSAGVVLASSSSVYGEQQHYPVTEDMEPRPHSPYAATKLAGEGFCRAWWRRFDVPTVSLRYFNVYGPGQRPGSPYSAVIPRFISSCLGSREPVIYGDGYQARDFTFLEDVVEANLLAARLPETVRGMAVNIGGGGSPTTVNELLSMIGQLTGATPRPMFEPARAGDIRRSEADISRAKSVFGFEPKVSIEDGLRRTVDWFRRHHRQAIGDPEPVRPRSKGRGPSSTSTS